MASLLVLNPESITENEVQGILAEMGYENIPPDHLHQFITDLKRMIRHDQKHSSFPRNMPSRVNFGHSQNSSAHSRTQEKAANTNERKLPSSPSSPVSLEDKGFLETEETKKKLKPNRVILNLDGCDISVEESMSLVKSHSCASVSEQIRTAQTTSGTSSSSDEKDTDLLSKPNFRMSTEVKHKTTQSRPKDLRLLKDPVRLYHWYNTHWQRHPPPSNPKQAAAFQPSQFH